ncbi:MAG: septum formation initiator family protein [Candidatus Margulisbacteria bacterium]|nr:septum formation initiator family protein [Candidatus Margulisiibacteriota bacterium]
MKRLGFILFILFIIYFIFLIRQDIMDNLDLKREARQTAINLKHESALAKKLKGRLTEQNSSLFIEEIARTRLGLIKKGETAYKIINN